MINGLGSVFTGMNEISSQKRTESRDSFSSVNSKKDSISPKVISGSSSKTLDKKETFSQNLKNNLDKNNNKGSDSKNIKESIAEQNDSNDFKSLKDDTSPQDLRAKKNKTSIASKSTGTNKTLDLQNGKNKNSLDQDQISVASQNINIQPQMQMFNTALVSEPNFASDTDTATDISSIDLNHSKVSEETKPVLKFMQTLYKDYGVTPEQFMKALEGMPTQEMLKSPQVASQKLLSQLDIPMASLPKVQKQFMEMVKELEQAPLQGASQSQKVDSSFFAGAHSLNSKNLKEDQVSKEGSQEKLEGLLSEDLLSETPSRTRRSDLALSKLSSGHPKSTLDALIEQKISRQALEPQNFAKSNQQSSLSSEWGVSQDGASEVNTNLQGQLFGGSGVAVDKLMENNSNMKINEINIKPQMGSGFFIDNRLNSANENLDSDSDALLEEDSFTEKIGSKDLKNKNLEDSNFANMQSLQNQKSNLNSIDAKGIISSQQPLDLDENVQKILNETKTLVDKGGGEMKVQLNPNGMGEIHLKVKVQDGQVNVQMTADTVEAKKLLESDINGLKIGLAEHKLNLNHMKVDLADQISQNLNQQRNDFNREQAREFLGQFRDFNQSFRQQVASRGSSDYRRQSQSATPDIRPIEANGRRSDSGRLHLVA